MAPQSLSAPRRYGTGHVIGSRRRGRGLLTQNIDGITKASIQKMARRGGVKRIQNSIYVTIKDIIEKKLKEVIPRAVLYTEHRGKKTVTSLDICYALRDTAGMVGCLKPVYGYDWPLRQFPDKAIRSRRNNLPPKQTEDLAQHHTDVSELARIAAITIHADNIVSSATPPVTTRTNSPTTEETKPLPNSDFDQDHNYYYDNEEYEDEDEMDLESDEETFHHQRIRAWADRVATDTPNSTLATPERGTPIVHHDTTVDTTQNADKGQRQVKLGFRVVKGSLVDGARVGCGRK